MQHPKCPICGYADMPYPPVPYNVCPCCGTEFGVADYYHSRDELRKQWIRNGMQWFSDLRKPPLNWSPASQLIQANLGADLIEPAGFVTESQQKSIRFPTKLFWQRAELTAYQVVVGA